MKLIVTIPALNEEETLAEVIREIPRHIAGVHRVEVLVLDDGSTDGTVAAAYEAGADYVISNGINRGLAYTFKRCLEEAIARGADVIVNTDADNHYDQSRIPDLIAPVLHGQADIVVGSRVLDKLQMRWTNKQGNRVANLIMQRLLRIPGIDVSSGFRAYSRVAALSLNVLSPHTYTHETLFAATDRRLKVLSLPIEARYVERPSRLISSLPAHIWRAGNAILQSILRYRPLQAYATLGFALAIAGVVPFARYLYFVAEDDGAGHLQSLIGGAALLFLGVQLIVVGLLARAIAWNRQLLEDVLYKLKDGKLQHEEATAAHAPEPENGRYKVA
ncbi:MAG TPA: glycosyltransferase family 2 protein [Dehalococcoidia bacterium]|nr:glycosyltransferase family 2 protein [Dehalococcoidia bacterium]